MLRRWPSSCIWRQGKFEKCIKSSGLDCSTLFSRNKCFKEKVDDNKSPNNWSGVPEINWKADGTDVENVELFRYPDCNSKHNESSVGDSELEFRINYAEWKFYELGTKFLNFFRFFEVKMYRYRRYSCIITTNRKSAGDEAPWCRQFYRTNRRTKCSANALSNEVITKCLFGTRFLNWSMWN